MNISYSVVQGNGWVLYTGEILHVENKIYSLFKGKAYELYKDDKGHLIEDKEVDIAQLIIIINREANRVDGLRDKMLDSIEQEIHKYEREHRTSGTGSD